MIRFLRRLMYLFALALPCIADNAGVNIRSESEPTNHESQLVETDGVWELTVRHDGVAVNRLLEATLKSIYVSPTGAVHTVSGFYAGKNRWKVRFRPGEAGHWTYEYTLSDQGKQLSAAEGSFEQTSNVHGGPVKIDPDNKYRWIFSSGHPYFPIGLQDCVGIDGARLEEMKIDGEGREDPGLFVSWNEYFSIYGDAGFNLFRFSRENCSPRLFDDLDHYHLEEMEAVDELLRSARRHGFRVMFGFFGYYHDRNFKKDLAGSTRQYVRKISGKKPPYMWDVEDVDTIEKEQRFIEYCVARWGVYVDFWQLLNESNASDEWLRLMAHHVRAVDPEARPITTSWNRPDLPFIDISTPHWYESESDGTSDLRVVQQAHEWKNAGKPVIVGEQGNTGMNWDPTSAERMRIRAWTALFEEISLIFWNTVWSKAGMHHGVYTPGAAANIYLGPEERGYIRVLQDYSSKLESGMQPLGVKVSAPNRVRAYALASQSKVGVYLHHFNDHKTPVRDLQISLKLPCVSKTGWVGDWFDPATGKILGRVELAASQNTLEVPAFMVDLALVIRDATCDHKSRGSSD